ncbi:unnamed protein product [Paramecium pentaurelia]|uniref:Uncharacterized protein n=1 Tax=Paramecium pentaurelia TaxID=43138 RepID=A0A8S1YJR3_9CILI|nr:unnamed protein product [Paramecium pentaurelia]
MNLPTSIFHFSQENNSQLIEILQCLQFTHYIIDLNMILTSPLHQTISSSTIILDQVLPTRLENYMIINIQQDQNITNYISNLSLNEFFNQIQYDQILQFAKPLVIQQKEQKQYQTINTQSDRQIGFQQIKTNGLLTNQIFNSKINNTRSISPQPISTINNKTQSNTLSQIPIIPTQSQIITDQFMNLNPNLSNFSNNSIINDKPQTHQQKYQLNKWTDESKEKLFQDNFMIKEEITQQVELNKIVIKKNEDPQFYQQFKKASPKLKQIKGSGLSPESYHLNKSKSPEVVQVNLKNHFKKQEITQNNEQQSQAINKLPQQFKKLQCDNSKRSNISKPFEQNNTKFAVIQSSRTAQQKNTRLLQQLAFQDSKNENQMKIIQSEKTLTPRINEKDYKDFQIMFNEQQQQYSKSRSQNKKQDEQYNDNIHHQSQNIKDQIIIKPQFELIKQEIPQQNISQKLIESKSIRGISPQNKSIPQQFTFIQQPPIPPLQKPIQIKIDIKQFMNTNQKKDQQLSISPIYNQRQNIGNIQIKLEVTNENGRSYFINLNFQK